MLLAPALIAHDLDIAPADPAVSAGDIHDEWNEYGPAADLLRERSPGETTHDDDG